jgi:hypothetical protein
VLSVELRASLSGVLGSAGRTHDARALSVTDLVSVSKNLPRDSRMTIEFASVEHLGCPLVVLSLTSAPTNREIAARLWLTTATVKDHVHHILTKTGLPNRTAIAAAWKRD